jgi:hypothetical protein
MNTNETERPAIVEDEHLEYLDMLRQSGATNMFGAGPYLVREFSVTRNNASIILTYWMRTFSQRHPR